MKHQIQFDAKDIARALCAYAKLAPDSKVRFLVDHSGIGGKLRDISAVINGDEAKEVAEPETTVLEVNGS